jgi:hypothetical protein
MTATVGTHYLDTPAIGIGLAADRTFNLVVKTRPTAVRGKLVLRAIQGRIALAANIEPRILSIRILTHKRAFCALLLNYIFLLSTE